MRDGGWWEEEEMWAVVEVVSVLFCRLASAGSSFGMVRQIGTRWREGGREEKGRGGGGMEW